MFLLDDGAIVYSASDLANAAACEFAVLRSLDATLGRIGPLELPADAMLERAARLGDRHEDVVLAGYVDRFGPWDRATGRGVAMIDRPERGSHKDRDVLVAKHAETVDVLRAGPDVVFQAGFFDGRFGGWADFVIRERTSEDPDGPPVYAVYDTKLARHAKITALLQLAAYGDQLLRSGIAVSPQVHLILGDLSTTTHRLPDLLPVYRERRARLQRILDEHQAADGPVAWGDARYRSCGRCDVCTPEITARRDVLLVAGLRTTQRERLAAAGIRTLDELAASRGPVAGIGERTLTTLRAQATLQSAQAPPQAPEPSSVPSAPVLFELFAPEVVGTLPPPDDGDLFFDFEGDPLWSEAGSTDWGLEYLFGVIEGPGGRPDGTSEPVFHPFWAHDRAQEKRALEDFLAYLAKRRAQYPDMHVYHYASYEKTALLRLAGRHGTGEAAVDQLLRDGVFVDLYATVRSCLRTGQSSYSLKKLEPLYMPTARSGDVTTAGESIVEYANACLVRDAGDLDEWSRRLADIADYNRYDCISTLGLRDWLLARAAEVGVSPGNVLAAADDDRADVFEDGPPVSGDDRDVPPATTPDVEDPADDPLARTLFAYADDAGARTDPALRTTDQQAVAMLAASLGYHVREEKPFWWAHFDRLLSPPDEWTERRSTFLAEDVQVLTPWHRPKARSTPRRVLRMVGRLEPGSELRAGTAVCALYDRPLPGCARTSQTGRRGWTDKVTVLEVLAEGVGDGARDVLIVEDGLRGVDDEHDALPMALGPGYPPQTKTVRAAIRAIAQDVIDHLPHIAPHPAMDLLRRVPPRTRTGAGLAATREGSGAYVDAIVSSVLDLDGSYLAVQGPPGTGKTFTGGHVIARLVAAGWRVGVVAQSHAVVENMLRSVAGAGVDPAQIGKKPSVGPDPAAPWRWLPETKFQQFYAAQSGGYVVGGTVWDFTNPGRLPDQPLDLLVIDEAGQFALANTIAVSGSARNLLLLGDPQQLPQVSQGRHPEPVDGSALGWLADGHDTLPEELGYFLAHTWRMHPALCDAVSGLSYEGRLTNVALTAERSLEGVPPGVACIRVPHAGNSVASAEEAAEVVRVVGTVVGRRWRDPAAGADGPLPATDVMVVAAYNAQVWEVRRRLDAAGYPGVRVGTVDRFQGQQAPVVIVSTSASSAADVPRGMEFLLNRNRINVAVSRGQWCAVIVRSVGLTDYLPARPEALEELGAFIGLCDTQSG
jgi:predicted RecB family nuclease